METVTKKVISQISVGETYLESSKRSGLYEVRVLQVQPEGDNYLQVITRSMIDFSVSTTIFPVDSEVLTIERTGTDAQNMRMFDEQASANGTSIPNADPWCWQKDWTTPTQATHIANSIEEEFTVPVVKKNDIWWTLVSIGGDVDIDLSFHSLDETEFKITAIE